ncbi:MAG: ABC transporter permease [Firmicutes bacterium]|nr:ABC transporter permease [Bacillota bacterium]
MKKVLFPVAFVAVVLVFWESAARFFHVEKWLLPSPSAIARALWDARGLLAAHTVRTLIEAGAGFALAVAVGLVLAAVIDGSPVVGRSIYPLLVASQTIPIIVLAPLLVIWFGYGLLPKVLVVALTCFFPVVVTTADGLAAADRDIQNLFRAMGATARQIFWKAKVPAAIPSLFTGLKVGGTYAVIGAVVGEWMGTDAGLGVFLTRSAHSYLTERVFAGIVVIAAVSLAIFGLLELLGRAAMPWRYRAGTTGNSKKTGTASQSAGTVPQN